MFRQIYARPSYFNCKKFSLVFDLEPLEYRHLKATSSSYERKSWRDSLTSYSMSVCSDKETSFPHPIPSNTCSTTNSNNGFQVILLQCFRKNLENMSACPIDAEIITSFCMVHIIASHGTPVISYKKDVLYCIYLNYPQQNDFFAEFALD